MYTMTARCNNVYGIHSKVTLGHEIAYMYTVHIRISKMFAVYICYVLVYALHIENMYTVHIRNYNTCIRTKKRNHTTRTLEHDIESMYKEHIQHERMNTFFGKGGQGVPVSRLVPSEGAITCREESRQRSTYIWYKTMDCVVGQTRVCTVLNRNNLR